MLQMCMMNIKVIKIQLKIIYFKLRSSQNKSTKETKKLWKSKINLSFYKEL